jgi:hypothetical protein
MDLLRLLALALIAQHPGQVVHARQCVGPSNLRKMDDGLMSS